MTKYVIINVDDKYESYSAYCNNIVDVRHWVINHLDLSKKWEIKTYFDCNSCGEEFLVNINENAKANTECKSCAYSSKRFNVYSKLGLEDRLY
jgi:formylmethanofuran dehydrogenase subunit E